jgi:hypothetical protein
MTARHPNERDPSKASRKGTSFNFRFPSMPTFRRSPYEVKLMQGQGKHDILNLVFKQTAIDVVEDVVTGLPVEFTWTRNSIKKVWNGYVSHVSTSLRANQDGTMNVVCIGASFPLKERATRVFTDSTIPEAIGVIAKEFGFEYVNDTHSRKFSQLILAGQSYWSWIQEQSNSIGYAVYVEGTTLFCRKLDSAITQNSSSIPLFSLKNPEVGLDSQSQFADRTLTNFKVLQGDYLEIDGLVRTSVVSGGVDPLSLETSVSTSSPALVGANLRATNSNVLFSEYRSDKVLGTKREVNVMSEDLAQKTRFTIPANIKGLGDYRCVPYGLVQVDGTGINTDGYWLIKEVTHSFIMYGQYEVEMTVLSDGVGTSLMKGYEMDKSNGRDLVNIFEALSSTRSQSTPRANKEPTLSQKLIPLNPRDNSFGPQSMRWKA